MSLYLPPRQWFQRRCGLTHEFFVSIAVVDVVVFREALIIISMLLWSKPDKPACRHRLHFNLKRRLYMAAIWAALSI
jgi:hypothetical protein